MKLKAKDELKGVFKFIRDDLKEQKMDFDDMVKEVKNSLEENDEISKLERKAILNIVQLTSHEPIKKKILSYEADPMKVIEDCEEELECNTY